MIECWSFLHFGHFSKDRKKVTKNVPRTLPKAAKLTPTWSSWRYHGPSSAQLAANLAHLASMLGPSSPQLRQNLHQIAPEIARSNPRDPKTTYGVARWLQDSPWDLIFHGFGVDFGLYFSMFSGVSPSILHGLPASSSRHVAAWRAQRIG